MSPGAHRRLRHRVGRALPPRERADELAGELRRALGGDVSGDADDGVVLHHEGPVEGEHVARADGLHAGGRPPGVAPVGMTLEEGSLQRLLRDDPVVVARLDDLREGLPLQPLELVEGERRRREEASEEIDEGLDVAGDDLGVDGDRGRRRVDGHLGPERVDAKVDLLRRHPLAAAAQHAHRDPREAGLVRRLDGGARSERQHDGDQRDGVRRLEEGERPAVQSEAQGRRLDVGARRAHWAASAAVPPSGRTRTMVRPTSPR